MTLLRQHALLRLLALNVLIGIGVAVLAVGGLLALDSHGLRHLIVADASPVLPVMLLLFGFVVTFGSVAMGAAIMGLGKGELPPPAGRAESVAAPRRSASIAWSGGRKIL